MNIKNRLTIKDYLGYGSGSIGDSMLYTFLNVFLMFFLTTVVHLSPGISGTIAAIGTVWNALFNPVLGFFSDKVRTRMGRRRPVILAFTLPMTFIVTLLFCNVALPAGLKPIYYGVLLMAYWTCYTGYFVPYNALGAAYTSDYDQRTVLRLYASFFNMVGTLICMVTPTLLVAFLVRQGISTPHAWTMAAALIGGVSTASILVTFFASKNKDIACVTPPAGHNATFHIGAFFRDYLSVANLPPMRYLVIASTASLICYTLVMSDMVYFFTYNLGFGATKTSLALTARALLGLAFLPVVGRLALRFDKRATLIGFYVLAAVLMVGLRLFGVSGAPTTMLYVLGAAICTCIYWALMPSIYYDVCDYDELVNGTPRQGTIVSFQGLVEAIASGAGSLILGLILQAAGFNGAQNTQPPEALSWIFTCGTVIPILFLLVASFAIYRYPLTREKHQEIRAKLGK